MHLRSPCPFLLVGFAWTNKIALGGTVCGIQSLGSALLQYMAELKPAGMDLVGEGFLSVICARARRLIEPEKADHRAVR